MQNLKKMLSKNLSKILFTIMVATLIVDALFFVKNIRTGNIGMCIFNAVMFAGIGYETLLMLVAVAKPADQKSVLILIGLDIMSFIAYVVCPFYVIISVLERHITLAIPVVICSALAAHFIFKPAIRNHID